MPQHIPLHIILGQNLADVGALHAKLRSRMNVAGACWAVVENLIQPSSSPEVLSDIGVSD